jgi:hypothetical protein
MAGVWGSLPVIDAVAVDERLDAVAGWCGGGSA